MNKNEILESKLARKLQEACAYTTAHGPRRLTSEKNSAARSQGPKASRVPEEFTFPLES